MTNLKQFAISALAAMMTTLILSAQTPQPGAAPQGRGGRGTPAPAVRSPEVNPDRTVTFRLRAPQAAAVELVGEVLQGKGPKAMTKDSDGVWSVTIGPLPPEIWPYNFRIEIGRASCRERA